MASSEADVWGWWRLADLRFEISKGRKRRQGREGQQGQEGQESCWNDRVNGLTFQNCCATHEPPPQERSQHSQPWARLIVAMICFLRSAETTPPS